MLTNIIELLHSSFNAGDVLLIGCIALTAWAIFWRLIFAQLLRRCKVTSIWYALYELGALGTFCILLFLLLIAILFIGSMQAIVGYGSKLLFPLFIFWGGFIAIVVLVIRAIRKKK